MPGRPSQFFSKGNKLPVKSLAVNPGDVGWQSGFTINDPDKYAWAIAVDGSKVYIGGDFKTAGNVIANNVVQWDGSGWTPLGSGLNGPVRSLAVDGRGHLYRSGFIHSGRGAAGLSCRLLERARLGSFRQRRKRRCLDGCG